MVRLRATEEGDQLWLLAAPLQDPDVIQHGDFSRRNRGWLRGRSEGGITDGVTSLFNMILVITWPAL